MRLFNEGFPSASLFMLHVKKDAVILKTYAINNKHTHPAKSRLLKLLQLFVYCIFV